MDYTKLRICKSSRIHTNAKSKHLRLSVIFDLILSLNVCYQTSVECVIPMCHFFFNKKSQTLRRVHNIVEPYFMTVNFPRQQTTSDSNPCLHCPHLTTTMADYTTLKELPEGIFSLLDTDLYKLTMQCAILKYLPDVREYSGAHTLTQH